MTAPVEEVTEQEQDCDDTGLRHAWCRRCVPPAPQLATAFCGFKTGLRLTGKSPDWPACVVCVDLRPLGCQMCGGGT